MKAAVLKQYRRIEWDTVPTPQISPAQVLIKIKYASICGSDQHIFNGDFHPRTRLPLIPGHEFTGEIVEVGQKVLTLHSRLLDMHEPLKDEIILSVYVSIQSGVPERFVYLG